MNEAETYAGAFVNGDKDQIQRLVDHMSVWKTDNWDKGVTIFSFDDGSAIYSSGPEFRPATQTEIVWARA